MVRLLSLALLALPAAADVAQWGENAVFGWQSSAELRDTEQPGAVAEIWYINGNGDPNVTGTVTIQHGDIVCTVAYASGYAEPDSIEPECPGYVASPRTLTIVDGTEGVIHLYASAPMM